MFFPEAFEVAAGGASLVSLVLYVRAIWRGDAQPNRFTHWIWFLISAIILASYLRSGGTTFWLQAMFVAYSLVIALHSVWFGERHERLRPWVVWLNWTCLAIALVSIPAWWALDRAFSGVAAVALPILAVNLLADAMGAIPTFEKAWNRPETEDRRAMLLSLLAATFNLGAVTEWTAADILWNGWMWNASLVYALFVYFRPRSVARGSEI